jgi:DNA replication and repair protein RecF
VICRLLLQDFRSFAAFDLAVTGRLVALVGDNGAGKTNLLEALSLLSPGRGLRRAENARIARKDGLGSYSLSVTLQDEGTLPERILGTGFRPQDGRQFRIDGAPVASSTAFAEYLRPIWLVPDLDGLFRGPAGDRRRFLDRLTLSIDPAHGSRVQALEKALRSRNRLLEETSPDPRWLEAVEAEIAASGIAVAAARRETLHHLAPFLKVQDSGSPFPYPLLSLVGEVDGWLENRSALDAEDYFKTVLHSSRRRDKAAGRTLAGPQTSDLVVTHGPDNKLASECSTGEQKALLIGLILAHARLLGESREAMPLILLDEVAAHLDPLRRAALYQILASLKGQFWLTGADPALFTELGSEAQIVTLPSRRDG